MLHQQNINVIDDDLANKEYDRLNRFRIRTAVQPFRLEPAVRGNSRNKTRRDYRSRYRSHSSQNAVSGNYQSRSQKKANACFKNKIRTQPWESADTLHRTALHAQWRIRGNTNRQQSNDPRTWHVKVCCNWLLRQKKYTAQSKAGHPGFAKQAVNYRGFA